MRTPESAEHVCFHGRGIAEGVSPKAPMKTGETQRMKESYYESLAHYISPESCLDGPRGRGEALIGENAGVVLSSENTLFRRPSWWTDAKAPYSTALCESSNAPAESGTRACADVFHTGIGRPRKGGLS